MNIATTQRKPTICLLILLLAMSGECIEIQQTEYIGSVTYYISAQPPFYSGAGEESTTITDGSFTNCLTQSKSRPSAFVTNVVCTTGVATSNQLSLAANSVIHFTASSTNITLVQVGYAYSWSAEFEITQSTVATLSMMLAQSHTGGTHGNPAMDFSISGNSLVYRETLFDISSTHITKEFSLTNGTYLVNYSSSDTLDLEDPGIASISEATQIQILFAPSP